MEAERIRVNSEKEDTFQTGQKAYRKVGDCCTRLGWETCPQFQRDQGRMGSNNLSQHSGQLPDLPQARDLLPNSNLKFTMSSAQC